VFSQAALRVSLLRFSLFQTFFVLVFFAGALVFAMLGAVCGDGGHVVLDMPLLGGNGASGQRAQLAVVDEHNFVASHFRGGCWGRSEWSRILGCVVLQQMVESGPNEMKQCTKPGHVKTAIRVKQACKPKKRLANVVTSISRSQSKHANVVPSHSFHARRFFLKALDRFYVHELLLLNDFLFHFSKTRTLPWK
jgi:hypothetical protein